MSGPLSPLARSNYRKYTSANPLQRWLIARFQGEVVNLVAEVLPMPNGCGDGFSPLTMRPARVLDVGCGEGFILERLSLLLPWLGLQGVDSDWAALELAHRRNPGLALHKASAEALPFADSHFDLVLCLEVLEHLEHPAAVLEELGRVSAGPVLLSVPHQPLFALANLARGKNLATWGEDAEHIHHWRVQEFLRLCSTNLEPRRVRFSFPWLLVLAHKRGRLN